MEWYGFTDGAFCLHTATAYLFPHPGANMTTGDAYFLATSFSIHTQLHILAILEALAA